MKLMGKILPFFTVLLGCIFSASAANTPSDSIPFDLGPASRIYVRCSVNGSRPLLFLVDTGATTMVINSNSLSEIPMEFNETVVNHGATGSHEVRKSTGNRFSMGKQSFTDAPFVAIPYAPDQWDGVLGLWLIRQQVTEINYADRKIYLYPHGSYTPPPNAIRLKVEYVMGIPVVPVQVTVNGKTHQLRLSVDTGSDRVLDLNTPFVKSTVSWAARSRFPPSAFPVPIPTEASWKTSCLTASSWVPANCRSFLGHSPPSPEASRAARKWTASWETTC